MLSIYKPEVYEDEILLQLGIQNPLELQWKRHPGEEFFVHIEEIQPRKNLLLLRESPKT